ncbi:MAG: hypothetical protein ACXVEF_19115 [Polyangiales bacterium]
MSARGMAFVAFVLGCHRAPAGDLPIGKDPAKPVVVAPAPKAPLVIVTAKLASSAFGPSIVVETHNQSDVAIAVEDELVVEREHDGVWTRVAEAYTTVGDCDVDLATSKVASRACRTVGARSVLAAAPWLGMSCSSQCAHICHWNVAHAPGRYRFVVTKCGEPEAKLVSDPIDWSH